MPVRLAEADVPVPPFVALTLPVVLGYVPSAVGVTFTEIAQLPPAFTDPPLRLIDIDPAVAPLTDPPHVLMRFGVLATCRLAGNVSLTATPVRAAVLPAGLVMVRVRVEGVLIGTLVGENALAIVGAFSTFKVADAVPAVPPSFELTLPVVLVAAPIVESVTLTLMLQLLPVLTVPPLKLSTVSPVFGEKVPPQELAGEPTTDSPAGKVSLTATPVWPTVLAAGLVMVMVSVEVLPEGMLVGLKLLVIVSGATTVKVVLAVPPVVLGLEEVTVPVVLTLLPGVDEVTVAVTVQLPLAGIDPPVSWMDVAVEVATEPLVHVVATPD